MRLEYNTAQRTVCIAAFFQLVSQSYGNNRGSVAVPACHRDTRFRWYQFILSVAMEKFFTPTRRYQDRFEDDRDDDDGPFEYTEVELAVAVEEFLLHFLDWKGLWAFLTGGVKQRILWITKYAFLVVEESGNVFQFHDDAPGRAIEVNFRGSSGQEQTLVLACGDGSIVSIVEADVFWRAMTASNSIQVTIRGIREGNLDLPPSGPILSQFLQESLSLQVLVFHGVLFKEEHCRALATLQRTDLKIKLSFCTIEPLDAEDAFIEWFRNNQVVTELDSCVMGGRIISALSGNKSIKKLTMASYSTDSSYYEEIRSLAQALPGNMGIEHLAIDLDLDIGSLKKSDETCRLLFRSLTMHPRIHFLSILSYSGIAKSTIMNAILQMLHLNTVVQTIELPGRIRREALYQNSILPRVEMNRRQFQVQRQALKRADPSIRPQLLGRALHVVRYNSNLTFLFLSENVPAFVRAGE
jgi:hypothetical protein